MNKKAVKRQSNLSKSNNIGSSSKKQKGNKSQSRDLVPSKKQKIVIEREEIPSVSGKLIGIGNNDIGQLSFDPDKVQEVKRPKLLSIDHNVVSAVAGAMHTIFLSDSGDVFTIGCNDDGALGRHVSDEEAFIPGKVDIPGKVVQISAGDSHSAVLNENGQVYIWGNFRDGNGQIGLTALGNPESLPYQILPDVKIIQIASGSNHFVCLDEKGIIYSCGCADDGQLGRVSHFFVDHGGRKQLGYILNPAPIRTRLKFNHIWAGSNQTLAREIDGRIYGFGLNNYNQLGISSGGQYYFPTETTLLIEKCWNMFSFGQFHTLALDDKGHVYSWGYKEYGRLGLEGSNDVPKPTIIENLKECICISAGSAVSLAVSQDGRLFSWGFGTNYQLGHGSDDDVYTPTHVNNKVLANMNVLSVSSGGQHTVLIAKEKNNLQV